MVPSVSSSSEDAAGKILLASSARVTTAEGISDTPCASTFAC